LQQFQTAAKLPGNPPVAAPHHPPTTPTPSRVPNRSIPSSQLTNPQHAEVQLVFKGLAGGNEVWDNNAGKNWQVVVELAHREGLVLQAHAGAALRGLVSSLLLRLDALVACGLLTPEQFAVLRNKAWAQDFGLIRAYDSVRSALWGVGAGGWGRHGCGPLQLGCTAEGWLA